MSGSRETSKKRGPQGLASARSKKSKMSVAPALASQPAALSQLEADHKTVALPEDIDEDDELAQLPALYSTAVDLLEKKDPQAALPIINGTIHEADRILRNTPPDTKLPYEFHAVYASALLDLSVLVDDEKAKEGEKANDFLEAALERSSLGIENGAGNGLGQLKLTRAKCMCSHVQKYMLEPDCKLSISLPIIQEAMELMDSSFKISLYRPVQLSRALNIIQDFADSLLDLEPVLHESMNKWAEDKWTAVLTDDQESVSALEGCGRVWLSLAQPFLAELEEADDLDTEEGAKSTSPSDTSTTLEKARKCLENSVELLNQALKCAEQNKQVTGELLCLLAESTISLANTFEDGDHYDKLETDTFKCLKLAQALDGFELPQRFADMLPGDSGSAALVNEIEEAE